MLTSDLIRATKKAGKLAPKYLSEKDRARLVPIAEALVATYQSMVGATRGELEEAAGAIPYGARDRLVVAGLRKLCDDRTELEQDSPLDPEQTRQLVFTLSAAAHKSTAGYDRTAVLTQAAAKLGAPESTVEKALFADLRDAQVVRAFEPLTASDLLARYDLALAQALLLRATRLVLRFKDSRPTIVRDVFRAARFHGLLHTIERDAGTTGWKITLDGPFSLFDSVQKYGLRLAMFLPTTLHLQTFELTADLAWGPTKDRVELRIASTDGLAALREPRAYERPEIAGLKTAFGALESSWDVADNDRVLVAKDGVAFVPDLVFCSQSTGEEVFLEVFGFWSRAAVWRRIEQAQAGLPARLVLAVSKGARVSEEVLDEGDGGSTLYVFKTAISAKEVLARLEAGSSTAPARRTKNVRG
ncbi:MAG: DUF790 family protein [Polyangiaceae bacterium]|nr:DUF790 family protein [Polyangiaceae bacterium]